MIPNLTSRATLRAASVTFLFSLASAVTAAADALPEGTIQVPMGAGTWIENPQGLPPGTSMMLMEGSPFTEGMFTFRMRVPAGTRLPPHWHPRDERVTILSGTARVGFGERFDEDTMATFGPGSFYLNPARSHHYVWIVEDTEMQLTGTGPWELHLLEPGESARSEPKP
jgi:uncharacterized RmlC-like cupin family protein